MRKLFVAAVFSALIGAAIGPSPVLAQQKTVKACQDEWRANRAENQKNGITEKAYVDKCRAGTAATGAPATTAANPAAPPPPAAKSAPSRTARPAPTTTGNAAGANQFPAEAQAKSRCPSDTVVWANLGSKIYHFAGTKSYGTTKDGAYMCERDATAEGIRAAKNEKHP